MKNLFANLKLDTWYLVFVYLGAILFIMTLFVPTQILTNRQVFLISAGLFLIGIGEWRSYRWYSEFKPPNVYTGPAALMRYQKREPDLFCNAAIVLGFLSLLLGGLNIFGLVIM